MTFSTLVRNPYSLIDMIHSGEDHLQLSDVVFMSMHTAFIICWVILSMKSVGDSTVRITWIIVKN